MSIKQEADGTYTVSYHKRHPKTNLPVSRRKIKIKSKAEAQRVFNSLVIDVENVFRQDIIPTWSKVVSLWQLDAKNRGLTIKTIDNYLCAIKAHTFNKWENRLVDSITTQEIRDIILISLNEKSEHHKKSMLKFIRCVFEYAVQAAIIQRNPAPKMKFNVGEKLTEVLTEQQVKLFLNRAKELNIEWYPHWTMALMTGMRTGELFALTWDKVNLEDRLIKVDTSWSSKNGFKSTKSGVDRILEIAPPLVGMLQKLKLQSTDKFVLPRLQHWTQGQQAHDLRMFLSGMNLPSIRFHSLRATWCTMLLTKGVELIRVMRIAGWKNMKTMMHYVRIAGVDIKGTSDCLSGLHDTSTAPGKLFILPNVVSGS